MRRLIVISAILMGCGGTSAWRLAEDTRDPDPAAFADALLEVDAVRAMGRLAAPGLVPTLQRALAEPKTRVMAAWAMGQYGLAESFDSQASLALELRSALKTWATDIKPEVRAAIALALGRLRDEAYVRAMTADAEPSVRAAAVLGLFWNTTLGAPPLAQESVAALVRLAEDPSPEVRRAVAIAGSRKPDARMEASFRTLAGEGGETAMFAVRGLGKLEQDAATIEVLIGLAKGVDRVVRIEAILALKDTARLPPLGAEPDVTVRAAYAMRTGVAEGEPSGWVRALAIGASEGFDPTWLDDADARVRAAGAAKLASTSDWQALFEKALVDPAPTVKLAAIGSLGAIEGAEPSSRLSVLLRTLPPDPTLRGAAVEAARARKARPLVPDLVAVAKASPEAKFVELRETVVDTLSELEAWDELATFVADPAPSVRAKAASALAKHEGRAQPVIDRRTSASPYLGAPAASRLVLDTERGTIVIALDRARAPTTTAAITALARRGFYDGTVFHRLVPNFVVQGGDPTGTGWGDAGFQLRDEVSEAPYTTGTVGLAKAGPDTGSCQLFVTLAPTPHLEGRYTIVGQVVSGLEVVMQLELGAIIRTARVID